jgi:hypothetical protein
MTKRLLTTLALGAVTAVATLGLAAPAKADNGYHKQGLYGWPDQCSGIGSYGVSQGTWHYWYCITDSHASWDAPGLYELWVD